MKYNLLNIILPIAEKSGYLLQEIFDNKITDFRLNSTTLLEVCCLVCLNLEENPIKAIWNSQHVFRKHAYKKKQTKITKKMSGSLLVHCCWLGSASLNCHSHSLCLNWSKATINCIYFNLVHHKTNTTKASLLINWKELTFQNSFYLGVHLEAIRRVFHL